MSARNHHRSCSATAEGVAEASENLGFLENGRSDIAIIENVAGRGVVEVRPAQPRPPCALPERAPAPQAFTTVVRHLEHYKWSLRIIKADRDLALNMARCRMYLVGLSPAALERAASHRARQEAAAAAALASQAAAMPAATGCSKCRHRSTV